MQDCILVSIHLVPSDKFRKDNESGVADEVRFRKIVGSLMYLTTTRPNIMYASCLLARFMQCPTIKHYGTAKRVLRHFRLWLGVQERSRSNAAWFCDSDWSGSEDDMRSTSRYAFTFGSGVFSWSSVKQHCVALSTTEANCISVAESTKTWLRFVLEDFGETQTVATPLNCDSISATTITKNPIFNRRLNIST